METIPKKTRDRILDAAQVSVLEKGFEATSIDEIVAAVEISKGGFFYHFSDKNALARALIERYIEEEDELFDDLFERARELNDDPLHAMLVGLKLLSELMADLPGGHPGCLVATACYQDRLFDKDVRKLNELAVSRWRARFRGYFAEIAERYPPNEPVNIDALADMVTGVIEGGIILSKAFREPEVLVSQIVLFRSFVKMLFTPRVRH